MRRRGLEPPPRLLVAAVTIALSVLPAPAAAAAASAPPWRLWPIDVGQFLVDSKGPNTSASLSWTVAAPLANVGGGAAVNFSYAIGTYTGCIPKCIKGGPDFSCVLRDSCAGWGLPGASVGSHGFVGGTGTVPWEDGGGPLRLDVTLPTVGYYTVTWFMPSGLNASFGVVVQQPFPTEGSRDPVFSVVSFLSLGTDGPSWTPENGGFAQADSPTWGQPKAFGNYRPEWTQWRKQIIGVLSRMGVASVREWGVGSDGGVFLQNGSLTFKPVAMEIREELAAAKIGIVDLELSPEAWMGVDWGGKQFARNLSAYSWKWKVQSELWQSSAGVQRDYIELYNELDIHSGAGSGDQYMAAVQAAAYGLAKGGDTKTKLLCGVVTDSAHDGWRQSMVDSGMLSVCDGVSFHSYDHSPLNWQGDDHSDLEIVGQWRAFLAANGHAGMPIMCTEAGTQQFTWDSVSDSVHPRGACTQSGSNSSCGIDSWGTQLTCINGGCTGSYRPSDLRDRIFAFEIVNKAISYKTYGVSRSFAFLLWYYNEASGNFGLTGRDGTPVRALAALGQAINVLGNAEYAGSLPWGNWQSASVFRQPDGQLVAVIKPGHQNTPPGGNSNPDEIFNSAGVGYRCNSKFPNCAVWGWFYPVTKLEGIDGRPLDTQHSACDGAGGCSFIDEDDGFIYAFLAPSAIHAIQRHTLVRHLASQRADEPTEPVRQKVPPLAFVMRWNLDLKKVEVLAGTQKPGGNTIGSQWGYAVSPGNASSFNFSAELHSLDTSSGASTTSAKLTLSIDGRNGEELAAVDVAVPRMGAVNASWAVDLTQHADASGEVVLRVSALAVKEEASGADLALPLVIRLIVGHWDCFSRGALNDKAACPDGDCNLCAAPKQPSP